MILVDANYIICGRRSSFTAPSSARMVGCPAIGDWYCLPLLVGSAVFIRTGTNTRVFEHPLSVEQALARVQSWLNQPCTRVVRPTERHWTVFKQVLTDGQVIANLVTFAHLAALAIEHGCELASTDSDFARFPKLKWLNPLT